MKLFIPILTIWLGSLFYYIYISTNVATPSDTHKIVSFFDESGSDLKYIYCSLLKKAKKSIFISSFGLSDTDIKAILKKKKAEGVKITYHNSKEEKKLRKKVSGLYHKKLLIIDNKELYIGSANCSKPSLSFDGNQIFGFHDKEFIQSVLQNNSYQSDDLTFFLLPKDKKIALKKLLLTIQEAKEKIYISMYALTHKEITKEIIIAHKKGVEVALFLDKGMCGGTCKKYVQLLKEAKIPIYVRAKGGILHHKSALIDDTFIFGSVNWSAAGFSKNEETLLFISHPCKSLLREINTFVKNTRYYSIPFK